MNLSGQRVLVLAPHTDDEIHCAGTIATMLAAGSEVFVVAFSACEQSVPAGYDEEVLRREFSLAMAALGVDVGHRDVGEMKVRHFPEDRQEILERMVMLNGEIEPTVVFCPSSTDIHQDHRVIHEEAVRAFKNCHYLLGYESPPNQRWAITNLFVEISHEALGAKLAAWEEYRSQVFRTHVTPGYFTGLASTRGAQARMRCGLAEAFEVISVTVRA